MMIPMRRSPAVSDGPVRAPLDVSAITAGLDKMSFSSFPAPRLRGVEAVVVEAWEEEEEEECEGGGDRAVETSKEEEEEECEGDGDRAVEAWEEEEEEEECEGDGDRAVETSKEEEEEEEEEEGNDDDNKGKEPLTPHN
ncbi:hypothetical protein HDU67_000802 [Dinochytrium kinnereticum]|nr:hypothetical protein HDU67_000802 [Dinochytrium kinnereticum]